jgi:hypothetical protein
VSSCATIRATFTLTPLLLPPFKKLARDLVASCSELRQPCSASRALRFSRRRWGRGGFSPSASERQRDHSKRGYSNRG